MGTSVDACVFIHVCMSELMDGWKFGWLNEGVDGHICMTGYMCGCVDTGINWWMDWLMMETRACRDRWLGSSMEDGWAGHHLSNRTLLRRTRFPFYILITRGLISPLDPGVGKEQNSTMFSVSAEGAGGAWPSAYWWCADQRYGRGAHCSHLSVPPRCAAPGPSQSVAQHPPHRERPDGSPDASGFYAHFHVEVRTPRRKGTCPGSPSGVPENAGHVGSKCPRLHCLAQPPCPQMPLTASLLEQPL